MDQDLIVPRVAFVINLARNNSQQLSPTRLQHLVQLFESQRIAATWAASEASALKPLANRSDRRSVHDLALQLHTPANTRQPNSNLAAQIQGFHHQLGQAPCAVIGNGSQLRNRANVLAQFGVQAVVCGPHETQPARPRAIGCGLWQVSPAVHLPWTTWKQRLLRRRPSLRHLSTVATDGIALVSIDSAALELHSLRHIGQFEKFLREISWSASRGQVEVASLSEVVAELATRNQARPQQSILRAAA